MAQRNGGPQTTAQALETMSSMFGKPYDMQARAKAVFPLPKKARGKHPLAKKENDKDFRFCVCDLHPVRFRRRLQRERACIHSPIARV